MLLCFSLALPAGPNPFAFVVCSVCMVRACVLYCGLRLVLFVRKEPPSLPSPRLASACPARSPLSRTDSRGHEVEHRPDGDARYKRYAICTMNVWSLRCSTLYALATSTVLYNSLKEERLAFKCAWVCWLLRRGRCRWEGSWELGGPTAVARR